MEQRQVDRLILAAEWTIENFSCWNQEIHGYEIAGPNYIPTVGSFQLYPRGRRGSGELSVTLKNPELSAYSGKLSIIGPDGSVLYTQEIDAPEETDEFTSEGPCVEIFSGIEFETIVAQFQKNEALNKDVLTLLLWIKDFIDIEVFCMVTEICVEDFSLQISGRIFDQFNSSDKTELWISNIFHGYTCNYDGINLYAFINDCDHSKIDLKWKYTAKEKIFVRTHTSVLNKDDTVMRWEEKERVLNSKEQWAVPNSLTRDEIREEGVCVLIRLKLISGKIHQFQCGLDFPYHVYVSPTISLRSETFNKIVQKTSENPSNQLGNSAVVPKSIFHNPSEISVNALSEDLMCLYQDQDFSDFHLKCDNVSFPVHKNILSARSQVFKTMLSTDVMKAASSELDIVDLDPSTLSRFLTYLYTGAVEEELQSESALKLYYAADKYQVPSLKRECSDFLFSNVSISNVCDILSLGNKHSGDKLISAAHDFILNHYNEVLKSKEWTCFMEREPLLAVKTVTHFAAKDNVGKLNTC